ncbi:hypothetical protein Tco_0415580, partial [Tanacetum coccineum]
MMDSNDTKIPMDPGTKLVKAEDGNSVDATYYRSLIGKSYRIFYYETIYLDDSEGIELKMVSTESLHLIPGTDKKFDGSFIVLTQPTNSSQDNI